MREKNSHFTSFVAIMNIVFHTSKLDKCPNNSFLEIERAIRLIVCLAWRREFFLGQSWTKYLH